MAGSALATPMSLPRALAVLLFLSGPFQGSAAAAPLESCLQGEAAHRAGDHGLVIELYTRCIEEEAPRDRQRAVAHNNRGVARLAKGDPARAIEDYDRALSLDPDYAAAIANRGMAHLALGDFVQALRDYGTAIDLDPGYGPAYASRCWLFGFMGYGEEALADCEASLGLAPDQPDVLDSRAFAYWLLEDREKARRDLVLARRLDPSRPRWELRFVEFERLFSVGYPDASVSVQSAGGQGETDSRAQPLRPDAQPAAAAGPH